MLDNLEEENCKVIIGFYAVVLASVSWLSVSGIGLMFLNVKTAISLSMLSITPLLIVCSYIVRKMYKSAEEAEAVQVAIRECEAGEAVAESDVAELLNKLRELETRIFDIEKKF